MSDDGLKADIKPVTRERQLPTRFRTLDDSTPILQSCRLFNRKQKLLEKQKKGNARMREYGSVSIPQEVFIATLRMGGSS